MSKFEDNVGGGAVAGGLGGLVATATESAAEKLGCDVETARKAGVVAAGAVATITAVILWKTPKK